MKKIGNMEKWTLFPIRDISGGMNMVMSPLQNSPDEMQILVNFAGDYIGGIRKSSGYITRGDAVTGVTSVLGLTNYYYGDTIKQVAVMQGASSADAYLYTSVSGTWSAQGMSLTSQVKPEFATFLDGLFMVDYSDATRFYNGTSWSTTTNVTDAPKARIVIPYGDKLYLGNTVIGSTTYESRVNMSSLPSTSYTITWDTSNTGNYFDVQPKDGDKLKAFGKNSGRLLIFKENTLWRYDTNSLTQLSGVPGTNNCRTVKEISGFGVTVYFHKSGVYLINGTEVTNISRKIQPIIDGVSSTNLDKLCAYSNGDYYFIYLGDISNTYEKLTINNCVVVFDIARGRIISVESLAHSPTIYATYRDDRSEMIYESADDTYESSEDTYNGLVTANDSIYFGADNGRIYQLGNTNPTHSGTTINASFQSHNYYPAGIHAKTNLKALKIYIQQCKRIRLYYSIDDAPWRPLGKVQQNDHEIYFEFPEQTHANRIKFKGVENSVGIYSRVLGIDIFHAPLNYLI